MQKVEFGDGRTATYEVVGGGEEPLLFFPGGPGFGAMIVRDDAELFAEHFTVYLIDPHGSGGSSPPVDPDEYSPQGTARWYEDVRQALGLGSVNVGGQSFGSLTALAYAGLFPGVTRRCLAVATRVMGADLDADEGGGGAEAEEAALSRHSDAAWYPQARKTIDEWTDRALAADDPAELDAMMVDVLPLYLAHPDEPEVRRRLDHFASLGWTTNLNATKVWENGLYQRVDLRPLLPRISAPTLLVAGEHDFICGPVHAAPVVDAVPSAELVVIPETGHIPALEAPDDYRAAVVEWLQRSPAAVA